MEAVKDLLEFLIPVDGYLPDGSPLGLQLSRLWSDRVEIVQLPSTTSKRLLVSTSRRQGLYHSLDVLTLVCQFLVKFLQQPRRISLLSFITAITSVDRFIYLKKTK